MLALSASPSVSSFSRFHGQSGRGSAVAALRAPEPVSQAAAIQQLWRTANSDAVSGETKIARVIARMERAAVRPALKRYNKPRSFDSGAGGWWENDWDDLALA
jgi:hypothetical protein